MDDTPMSIDRASGDWGDYSFQYSLWHPASDESLASQARAREGVLRLLVADLKRGRALDIGCGFGAGVVALREMGFEASGVDSSPSQIAGGRELGVPVVHSQDIAGYINEIPHGSLTLATLIDVLEHIPAPLHIPLLRAIWDALEPGGRVVIQVPNAGSLAAAYFLHQDYTHRLSFTAISLRYVLMNAGFDDIQFLRDKPMPGDWRVMTQPGRHQLRRRLARRVWKALFRAEVGDIDPALERYDLNLIVRAARPR